MRGEGDQKVSVFVHAQGIKTVHAEGGGVKKWQNFVHVVVECPFNIAITYYSNAVNLKFHTIINITITWINITITWI